MNTITYTLISEGPHGERAERTITEPLMPARFCGLVMRLLDGRYRDGELLIALHARRTDL